MTEITLHQFPFSHFNEKARWALAYKGIHYHREDYLPGPHMPQIKRLSGQSSTPVLSADGQIISGSAAIIEYLEKQVPTPPLFPSDTGHLAQVTDLIQWLDTDVGPSNRTVLFGAMINEGGYMTGMFSNQRALPVRWFYRFTFPMARGLIAEANGVNDDNIARCQEVTSDAMDRIAELVKETGYLVGDTFTAADLTAAALFAPLANPSHPDMRRPEPVPMTVRSVIDRYAGHPTVAWVNQMYTKHRP